MQNTNVRPKPQDPAALARAPGAKIYKYHEQWAVENGYRDNDLLNASNTQAFDQQASKDSSTVDQRARSTDKQAKPSSNRQASMDPGTSFKHS